MCGRYALISGKKVFLSWEKMKTLERKGIPYEILPRYNAAPTDIMPVVAVHSNDLKVMLMQWWLIPRTAREFKPITGNDGRPLATFNAVGEQIDTSRLFSEYFRNSRCLVPADAFYEWKKITIEKETPRGTKTYVERHPYCIRMKDEKPFMFAGVCSFWNDPRSDDERASYAIITTTPNKLMTDIHNRMPVILPEKHFEQWLDPKNHNITELKTLLAPYPDEEMKAYPVSKLVSNAKNDVPECLIPINSLGNPSNDKSKNRVRQEPDLFSQADDA